MGNLSDRLIHGFVRDFVQIRLGPLSTGIFNVADLAITTGVLLLLWHGLWDAIQSQRRYEA